MTAERVSGLSLEDIRDPHTTEGDVIVAGQTVLIHGADAFVDLEHDRLADIGDVDVVLDVLGGEILDRLAQLVRPGGPLVMIAEPPRVHPDGARASNGEVAFLTPFLSVGASWV